MRLDLDREKCGGLSDESDELRFVGVSGERQRFFDMFRGLIGVRPRKDETREHTLFGHAQFVGEEQSFMCDGERFIESAGFDRGL